MHRTVNVEFLRIGLLFLTLSLMLIGCKQSPIEDYENNGDEKISVAISVSSNFDPSASVRANNPSTRAHIYTNVSSSATDYPGHNLGLTYYYYYPGDGYTRTNVKWEDDSVGNVRIWSQMSELSTPMTWKSATEACQVFAYAPYVETTNLSQLFALPFKVSSHQEHGIDSSDFVRFYDNAFQPGSNLQKLNICFDHQLCKLTIKLKAGPSQQVTQGQIDSLARCKVGLVCDSINYNLFTIPSDQANPAQADKYPVTTISGNKKDSTTIYTWVPENADSSTQICILPPQTIKKDSAFVQLLIFDKVTCFQKLMVYRPTQDFILKPNTSYTLNLELGDTELKMSSVIVEGWKEEHESVIDIK